MTSQQPTAAQLNSGEAAISDCSCLRHTSTHSRRHTRARERTCVQLCVCVFGAKVVY